MCLVWCFFTWAQLFLFPSFKFCIKFSCDVKHFCDKELVSILRYLVKMLYLLINLVKLIQKIKKPKPTTKELSNGLSRNVFLLFKFFENKQTLQFLNLRILKGNEIQGYEIRCWLYSLLGRLNLYIRTTYKCEIRYDTHENFAHGTVKQVFL